MLLGASVSLFQQYGSPNGADRLRDVAHAGSGRHPTLSRVRAGPAGPGCEADEPIEEAGVDYEVELESVPGRTQAEEVLTVTYPDGRADRMRLHEYERVYAVPGLYEEVVQRRLECASPAKIAGDVVAAAAVAGDAASDLRVFDLGAGNGVVAEELSARGAAAFVGLDNIAAAREAAERDRPGLYAEYLVGDLADHPRVPGAIDEHGLDCLVAVGALGMGHISAASFDAAWRRFPAGAWLGVTIPEGLAAPGASDFGDYLEEETSVGRLEVLEQERYRHRLLMDGSEVFYVAIVGRRRSG